MSGERKGASGLFFLLPWVSRISQSHRRHARKKAQMSQTDFEIAYDGEAVADGSMDVYEFAPALLAAGKLLRRANHVLNGDASTVRVRVKTAPPPGSFPVELQLYLDTATQVSMMGAPDTHQLLTVLGLVVGDKVGAINSLLSLLKTLRDKKAEVVPGDTNAGSVVMNIDAEHVTVNNNVVSLYNDSQTQRYVREVLTPVTKPGVDEFQVRENGKVMSRVSKSEAEDIIKASRDLDDEDLDYGTFTQWFYAAPKWKEGHMWPFWNNQGTSFSATIQDDVFWERVHADEISFTEHTQLRVRVEWSQERDNKGQIKPRHIVTNVLDIRAVDNTHQISILEEEGS